MSPVSVRRWSSYNGGLGGSASQLVGGGATYPPPLDPENHPIKVSEGGLLAFKPLDLKLWSVRYTQDRWLWPSKKASYGTVANGCGDVPLVCRMIVRESGEPE